MQVTTVVVKGVILNLDCHAGAFSVLDRFFLLFQMHTTAGRAFTDNDMFGPQGCYTFLRSMVRAPHSI